MTDFPTDAEREALHKRHGCAPVADENTTLGRLVYFCDRHHVGWLTDVNACAHVDAALDALAPLIRAREAAAWDEGYGEGVQRGIGLERTGHLVTRRHELGPIPTNPYKEADDDHTD